jgi:molybdate transport system ATP-binding protein
MSSDLIAQFEKRFRGGASVSADFRVPVESFSITVLFGPSGCGKSTVLRCLAGLERPEEGTIRFGDEKWFDSARRVCTSPQRRDVGFLFQSYALFPHLTVAENIGYGLTSFPRAARDQRVGDLLDVLGLEGLGRRSVHEISGGQQQRVALARAIARRPRLLLLDEPLSALDTSLRDELRQELRRQIELFGIPTILVTHDRNEALAIAQRIVVMRDGRMQQVGTIEDVLANPANLAVARSMGIENIVPLREWNVHAQPAVQRKDAGAAESSGHEEFVCITGEVVQLRRATKGEQPGAEEYRLTGRLIAAANEGAVVRATLDCGVRLVALVPRREFDACGLKPGDAVTASVSTGALRVVHA